MSSLALWLSEALMTYLLQLFMCSPMVLLYPADSPLQCLATSHFLFIYTVSILSYSAHYRIICMLSWTTSPILKVIPIYLLNIIFHYFLRMVFFPWSILLQSTLCTYKHNGLCKFLMGSAFPTSDKDLLMGIVGYFIQKHCPLTITYQSLLSDRRERQIFSFGFQKNGSILLQRHY